MGGFLGGPPLRSLSPKMALDTLYSGVLLAGCWGGLPGAVLARAAASRSFMTSSGFFKIDLRNRGVVGYGVERGDSLIACLVLVLGDGVRGLRGVVITTAPPATAPSSLEST